ncbi:hypothetical protein [Bradyrhizobium sp. Ash2021]|uniref:hypothetical protein n=1 Tax=Bradyrhizobium sp. Ash2021 TaxID=2954771 RepID=UPI002814D2AC|nr:hypothetical protein [Bradyrhizobium sp. Ash2021]WMT73938.1 hypothetical protein NL528_39505 [Bradyrhizobium sp. Ash2021]
MDKRPRRKRSDRETQKTGREARRSTLFARPSIRLTRRHYFDTRDGSLITKGLVEVQLDVRGSTGFVCPRDGGLRHVKRGCGRGCICLQCDAAPRRDGKPPKATVATCSCILCRQRRERRQ